MASIQPIQMAFGYPPELAVSKGTIENKKEATVYLPAIAVGGDTTLGSGGGGVGDRSEW